MLLTVAWNTIKDNSTVVGTVPEKYTVVNVDVSADHNVVLGTLLAKTRQAQTHMDRERDAQTRKRKRRSRTLNKKTPRTLRSASRPLSPVEFPYKDTYVTVTFALSIINTNEKFHDRNLEKIIRQGYHTS